LSFILVPRLITVDRRERDRRVAGSTRTSTTATPPPSNASMPARNARRQHVRRRIGPNLGALAARQGRQIGLGIAMRWPIQRLATGGFVPPPCGPGAIRR